MKRNIWIILSVAVLALMVLGFMAYHGSGDKTPIKIKTDILQYSPTMSSTVGIGLMPVYPATLDNATIGFNWHTNYGYFVSWVSPDFKVNILGPDVSTNDTKIYWSYSPDDMNADKPPVRITLTLVDKASGEAINKTVLDIGWKEKYIATTQ